MKLWRILGFEFAYQISRSSTWIYMAVLLSFTITMNLLISPGDGVYSNNTFHITSVTVIGGLIWLIMSATIAGEAAARDAQTRMHPLIYSAPLTKLDYLGGRFLAAFAINALLILSLPVGVLLSFYIPGLDNDELGPFRASAYLSVYWLISLPNVFIATALQFTLSALSRYVMASYLASLLLAIFAQIIAMTAAKLFGNWDLIRLLDPVGVSGIVGSELQTWTATEKNTRLVTLEGMFLWNRILWLGVAAGLLLFTYIRFSFNRREKKTWWTGFKRRPIVPVTFSEIPVPTAISVPQAHQTFNLETYCRQTLTIAWASFKKVARNPVGLTLVGAVVLGSAVFGGRILTQFEIPLLPTTQQVLDYLISPVGNVSTPWVVIPLLIMYFAGELVWSERDTGLSDITDVMPVSEGVLFAGKFVGLGLVIIAWLAFLMAGGILMQLDVGYNNFQIGLYLKALFGLQLADYLLFALVSLVVHALVHHKQMGHLVILLVFCFISFPSIFQVEHNLLIFTADPGWWFTDMRGFGPTIRPWLWFKAYWITWALLCAVAARLFWVRGKEHSLKYRLQLARRRFTGSTVRVTFIASGLIITLGGVIFYNTNVLNDYMTVADLNKRKAEYEKRYGKYRRTPQPQLTATKLHVEIYPDLQRVEIRAAYTLVNKDTVIMDTLHVDSNSGIEPAEVAFNRQVSHVLTDKEHGHQIYALARPLPPGDSLQLNFEVHHQQRGFSHSGTNALVIRNGTYFTNYDLLPAIGYQRYRELKDAVLRKKFDLVARAAIPSLYDMEARKRPFSTDTNTFEAIVGTSHDEVAIAPGALYKTWKKGDRRYFHYKTDAPIRGEYSFLSGHYTVRETKWNDIAIRIYHHPDHAMNIDRLQRSVHASLEFYEEQFGPYPFGHLTITERPGADGGLNSEASMVDYGEPFSIMNPDTSATGFDLPYYILAHEVAHQWWGGAGLTPAYVEGAGVLVESLAVYSGMQVLEKNYGEGHLRQYLSFLHSFYEMPRSLASASLLQANESFLYYRKGGLAMYVLSKYIGQEKVNSALRHLLQRHKSGVLPLATTLDLYQELQTVTPDSLSYMLQDLFKKNIYWRLKTKQFVAEQTKTGKWEVTLKVQAQKVVVDSTGYEKEEPMNDWLEIGIYEEQKGLNEPLYLQMHRIRSGDQIIKVTVPRKPERGGIDPNYLMIDLRREDNLMSMEED